MSGEPSGGRVVAGRYRLLGPLGEGGSGIVWRARDEILGREVAVKEVRAPAGLDPEAARALYAQVEREAGDAARISHRGVVRVHDVASEDGRPWIVMELIRGLSLAEVLAAEGPLPPQRVAHLGEQLLVALRSAHEAGVLHRDVKPANVLVGNDGRVMLSDFGTVRPAGFAAPEYLAPERLSGREPGPDSDLWSLGSLLYAAVEGGPPPPLREGAAGIAAPGRAGPLAPVLEGLLRREPAERLPAPEAARMLRVVGAGGSVRASGGPVSDSAARPAATGYRDGSGDRAGDGGTDRTGSAGRSDRAGSAGSAGAGGGSPAPVPPDEAVPRRAGLVLTAGVLVLLVALVALIWLLAG
ncbi:serine/threonine-protein kinase [Streptomyces sp. NPDC051211]|uniref:serine/threonine-protein kinase n=1 Tax=Streptomyces sp. NPDC051211 TaxID=3154643 RepID=UPI00344D67FC